MPLRGGDVREPGCFCVLFANCGALHGREAAPAEACFGVACTRTLAPSCAHRLASQRQEEHTVLSKPSTPRGSRRWLHSASAVRAGRTKSHGKSSSCSPVATQMAIKARFHAVAVLVEPWIYSHIIKVDPYYQGLPCTDPPGQPAVVRLAGLFLLYPGTVTGAAPMCLHFWSLHTCRVLLCFKHAGGSVSAPSHRCLRRQAPRAVSRVWL